MYLSASTMGKIKVGEPVIIVKDKLFDEIIIRDIAGNALGIAMDFNVEGCLTKEFVKSRINSDEKLLGEVVLISGGVCIIGCDSSALNIINSKMNTEQNNYRIYFG